MSANVVAPGAIEFGHAPPAVATGAEEPSALAAKAAGRAREWNAVIHIRPIHLATGSGAITEPD